MGGTSFPRVPTLSLTEVEIDVQIVTSPMYVEQIVQLDVEKKLQEMHFLYVLSRIVTNFSLTRRHLLCFIPYLFSGHLSLPSSLNVLSRPMRPK